MNKLVLVVFSIPLLLSFQNCSPTGFQSPLGSQSGFSSTLPDNSSNEIDDQDDDIVISPVVDPPVVNPPVQPTTPTITLPALTYLPPSLGPRYANGIEPRSSTACEAISPSRCWYVDASAPAGGNGSISSPYNSFETVVGYMNGYDYNPGLIQSGDYLYLKGTFNVNNGNKKIIIRRANQGGTSARPTVVKTWPGNPRAILNGQNTQGDLIVVANTGSVTFSNFEIRNALARGADFGTSHIIFEDMVVRDTVGDGAMGIGGGIHFYGGGGAEHIVRNCYFYSNNQTGSGTHNNLGGVNMTSDSEAPDTGKLIIYNNVFEKEINGVRHKHSGNIDTDIYHNLFMDSEQGVFVRSAKTRIHHNIFLNMSSSGVMAYLENTHQDIYLEVYNNNFFNTNNLMNHIVGVTAHQTYINIHHNLYQDTSSSNVLDLNAYFRPRLQGSNNIFGVKSTCSFILSPITSFDSYRSIFSDSTSALNIINSNGTDASVHNAFYNQNLSQMRSRNIGAFPP